MLSLHLNLCGQVSKIPFEFMGIPKSIAFSLEFNIRVPKIMSFYTFSVL